MNSNDRRTVAVASFAHGLVHTYELTIPLLIPIWMTTYTVDTAMIGFVVTVGYVLFGLGALPSGILADSYDTRKLIAISVLGMGVGFVIISLAPSIFILTIGLIVWGGSASMYHPTGLSLISRTVSERGRGLAFHGVAGNVGTAVGPLLVSVLLLELSWRYVASLLVAPALLVGIVTLLVPIEKPARVSNGGMAVDPQGGFSMAEFGASSKRLFARGFAVIFLLVVLEGLFYRGILTFLPDVFDTVITSESAITADLFRGTSQYLYSGLLLVGVFGQYVGGWLVDRVNPVRGLVFVFIGLAGVSAMFAAITQPSVWNLVPLSILLGVFLFGEQPLMQATVADYSSSDTRGLSYGYTYAGVFGVGALGATIAGYVLTRASFSWLFGLLAILAIIAAIVSERLRRGDNRSLEVK
ncbi:Sugar phosphate permease [Haladaptatus litoreus]|uniref:Sugar phosphate permease n=1 Tax=Haladaptatus litoreus TaxID=553468 RepID=A0A1N7DHC5_9EURY|nr:MFS transporter [Haladaptatus litoreus]SIR75289.1 Sugar phosphate permease [Haladaptatus litoreus]